jgi:hypothetical protein
MKYIKKLLVFIRYSDGDLKLYNFKRIYAMDFLVEYTLFYFMYPVIAYGYSTFLQ